MLLLKPLLFLTEVLKSSAKLAAMAFRNQAWHIGSFECEAFLQQTPLFTN